MPEKLNIFSILMVPVLKYTKPWIKATVYTMSSTVLNKTIYKRVHTRAKSSSVVNIWGSLSMAMTLRHRSTLNWVHQEAL